VEKRRVLVVGSDLCRAYVRKTVPEPKLDIGIELNMEPTLDGIQIGEWLDETTRHIRSLLLEFAQPPPEINSLGIQRVR
jgi:hypothetical protein